jgi:hypothetical protein
MTQLSPLQERYAEINEIRAELEKLGDGVYLCSIYDRKKRIVAGRICVATPAVAAIMIADKSHRLATNDEIAAWKQDQDIRGGKQTQTQAKKDSKINLDLGSLVGTLADQIRRQVEEQVRERTPAPAPVAQAPAPVHAPVRPPAPAVQMNKGQQANQKPADDKTQAPAEQTA